MGLQKMKTQIVPYQKKQYFGKNAWKNEGGISAGLAISKNNIIFFLLSFLLGRVSLFGVLCLLDLLFMRRQSHQMQTDF